MKKAPGLLESRVLFGRNKHSGVDPVGLVQLPFRGIAEFLRRQHSVPSGSTTTQSALPYAPVPDASEKARILPRAKKCPPDTFYTSVRTGAALSNPFSSSANKKRPSERMVFFCWQRMRDSNPRKRSQSPVCYRYTNPLGGDNRTRTCDLMRVKHAL